MLNSYVQHVESIKDSGLIERNLGDGYKYSIVATGLPQTTESAQAPTNISYARVKFETPKGEYQLSGKVFTNRSEIGFAYAGPVKAICELIDYRYARVKGSSAYVLHPLVHRSFIEDIQIWIYGPTVNSLESKKEIVVVVKMFRFSSFVWLGAILLSIGGFWLSFKRFRSDKTYSVRFIE